MSVAKASRSYKMYAKRLEKLGIFKLRDFLFHIPFRYEDYSLVSKIGQIQPGETVTLKGTVDEINNVYTRRYKTIQRAVISDETGSVNIMWFNQPFLTKAIKKGDKISVSGKVDLDKNTPILISPIYEVIFEDQTIHTGRLVPVYPETRGISSKWLRRQIFKLLEDLNQVEEYLPDEFLEKNSLMEIKQALSRIHFPKNFEEEQKARERLSFDELLQIQLSVVTRKKEWEKEKVNKPWEIKKNENKIQNLIKSLPFELTNAQKKAIQDILNDFEKEKAMNRLLEGDVGSGKTVVAAIAIYEAYLNGFQSAFMAPTEILANQHFKTLTELLGKKGVGIELLTGSTKLKDKDFNLLVGTHALIHKKAEFKNLGLIVIDEQQRFGVEQRSLIRQKGKNPHLLTMTATPIPRTVALTIYGDLDLSILDEMPKERLKIKTWLVPPEKRTGAYVWIEKKVKEGDQVFIVCPFIEESETMVTIKAAKKEFERLSKDVFPNLSLGLMHGKMKSAEKDKILTDFKDKKIDILVSTPVIEVGIDISNATIMLIEEAERFGLAQLHQLRGRVGRGNKQSFCLLFTQSKNPQTLERLKSLETIFSGALLSELDLQLRGAGQVYGTIQHGTPRLKVASFSDFELIKKTKDKAAEIFDNLDKFPRLKKIIEESKNKNISPD